MLRTIAGEASRESSVGSEKNAPTQPYSIPDKKRKRKKSDEISEVMKVLKDMSSDGSNELVQQNLRLENMKLQIEVLNQMFASLQNAPQVLQPQIQKKIDELTKQIYG